MKTKPHIKGAVKDRKKMPEGTSIINRYFMVECDNEQDCQEIIAAISRKTNITWNFDTKAAMIHFDPKTRTLLVSKSINKIPKPIRL